MKIKAKYISDDKGYYFIELKEFFKAFLGLCLNTRRKK